MTEALERVARTHGIAVFQRRLITGAQPPISSDVLEKIESRCIGPVPDGLKALWSTSFGGALDYSLSVDFDGQIESFSFTEIFFPGSDHYHDLLGWMDHEADLAEEAAAQNGVEWAGKLSHLPFGGFEYLCRLYVCVEPGPDYGAVYAWTQGLPPAWTLRLNRDAIARVADDVPSLFHMLDLERDPFTTDAEDFESGIDMAGIIKDLPSKDSALAGELSAVVREAVLDWRSALVQGDIAAKPRLRRVALEYAAANGDIVLMSRLIAVGCDISERYRGGGNMLDHTLAHGHVEAAEWLIDHGADVEKAVINGANQAPAAMIADLLRSGAQSTPLAAVAAARSGRTDNARLIVDALVGADIDSVVSLIEDLAKWAVGTEATAKRIEARKLASNRSAQQYRDEGQNMRDLREYCQSVLPPRTSNLSKRRHPLVGWWNRLSGR